MLKIQTDDRNYYPCYVGRGLLEELKLYLEPAHFRGQKILVVADSNTAPLFYHKVSNQLEDLGYAVDHFTFTAGEEQKNETTLGRLLAKAFEFNLSRQDKFLALGGGVVGDLCGFAAAIYMRGIPYIQVPTTYLAQIDSSVGGKTGIDTPYGKNLLGAFKQPEIVLADVDVLMTLPPRELRSGWAEMIKYGLLEGEGLFSEIEGSHSLYPSTEMLSAGIRAKAKIVAQDTLERGLRAVLNLGHTFGHAIESASGYRRYTHGEGVSIGLLCALRLGEVLGFRDGNLLARTQSLLQRFGLPVFTELTVAEILPFINKDKKTTSAGTTMVFLETLGEARLQNLTSEKLATLAEHLEGYTLGVTKGFQSVRLSPSELTGVVLPPPSKSMAHRLIMAVALAQDGGDFTSYISNCKEAMSNDIQATIVGINQIIAAYRARSEDRIEVDCGESGSTIRFLIPIAAALGVSVRFTGSGRLPYRPLNEYIEVLGNHGVDLRFPEEDGLYLPLEIRGQLEADAYALAGDSSSQYITGMLYGMALLPEASHLSLTTQLESAPYVDLSLEVLRNFGIEITREEDPNAHITYHVRGGQNYRMPSSMVEIERDYSQAAFWYLAKFLGHTIEVQGMREDSLQGDKAFIMCLEKLQERKDRDSSELIEIDISQFPDLFPALSVACACAGEGKKTKLSNAQRLKIKESDRLWASYDMLTRLGVVCELGEDYLVVTGVSKLIGASLSSYNDHRLAMAGSIAAMSASGESTLDGAEAVNKSYPAFYRDLRRVGGQIVEDV